MCSVFKNGFERATLVLSFSRFIHGLTVGIETVALVSLLNFAVMACRDSKHFYEHKTSVTAKIFHFKIARSLLFQPSYDFSCLHIASKWMAVCRFDISGKSKWSAVQ